jgi:endogenous inhibitor of DNA gyrase (YacG/DUF329 family)
MTRVACPTCNRPVIWNQDAVWRPFCSERCKLIDLGEWFAETHRIPDAENTSVDYSGRDEEPDSRL